MEITTKSGSSVQQRTPTKRSKSKKKNNPIKVVYISNPLKVKTSASEFRALVQELTGQYAESPPDPTRFQDPNSDDSGGGGGGGGSGSDDWHQTDSDNCLTKVVVHDEICHTLAVPPQVDPSDYSQGQPEGGSSLESFEPFDDVFTSQMIDNISTFLPASVFYESPQLDQVMMQCNYIHQ